VTAIRAITDGSSADSYGTLIRYSLRCDPMPEHRTQTQPWNIFRTRNRNEAGVDRRRQPSRSQQNLYCQLYSPSMSGGLPLGLRG
jgi:hypothetical protein